MRYMRRMDLPSADQAEAVERIRANAARAGSVRRWALDSGLDLAYVRDVLAGRRTPSAGLVEALGGRVTVAVEWDTPGVLWPE